MDEDYTEMQIDALREMGNIGASHASAALTELVKREIYVDVSECLICGSGALGEDMAHDGGRIVAVYFSATGKETGSMIMYLPADKAKVLSGLLLGREGTEPLDDDDLAAVAEVGNICASAYLNALSDMLEITLLPSPPEVVVGPGSEIRSGTLLSRIPPGGKLILIKTRFTCDDQVFPGSILYVPDPDSHRLMLRRFEVE